MSWLELKVPPLAVALLIGVGMWLPVRNTADIAEGWRLIAAGLLVVLSSGVILAGIATMTQARTTVDPFRPHTAERLVSAGIFRASRNPIYLGLLLALAGWAAFLGHWISTLGLPAFVLYMNRFQIRLEERALAAKFGRAYDDYRQSVRRWI